MSKLDLTELAPTEFRERLQEHFTRRKKKPFRVRQVEEWVFQHLATSMDEMSNLPVGEREGLREAFTLQGLEAATISRSKDGTVKHLWRLSDGELVESVLIPTADRLTLCLSSQAGCAMGCTFCATGWSGFRRQLGAGEIVAQFRGSQRWALDNGYPNISNVVYMGMGEPLSNRKAVHPSLTILNQGYGLGARRITVSTVGVVPGIIELARRPEQFRLAVSLHAPNSKLRRELIPLEKRYPLPELTRALHEFNRGGGRRITFEYTMIDGVNDGKPLAVELAELAVELDAFVNLIPFNPIPYQDWGASPRGRIAFFSRVLHDRGVDNAVREPRGRDIDAACGQLRASALVELKPVRDPGK